MEKEKIKTTRKKKVTTKRQDANQPPKKRKKGHYLTNKDLLPEVIKSREQGQITDKLARMFQLLAARYASKGSLANYPFNEDMQAFAMLSLVKTWKGFDPNRGSNPFAFYTQCIKNSFRQFLNVEKRHRNTRDILLVEKGLEPSYSYAIEQKQKEEQEKLKRAEKDKSTQEESKLDDKSNNLLSY